MRVTDDQILTAQTMAADASIIQQLEQIFAYSMEAVYTGSPNGTLSLQASNDYNPNTGNGTWTEIVDSPNAITGAGSSFWNVTSSNYKFVKLVYVRSSGTGSLSVNFYGRGF